MAHINGYDEYLKKLAALPCNATGFTISRETFGRLSYYTIWRDKYVGYYKEPNNINDAVAALKQQCKPDNERSVFIRPSWWTDEYEQLYMEV